MGGALVLPLDVEPYGPGDSEQAASVRVLQRGVAALGRRFAQYVVGAGLYASAPFLHAAGHLALHTVVRLKRISRPCWPPPMPALRRSRLG